MQDMLNQEAQIESLRQENERYRNLLSYLSAGILVTSHSREKNKSKILEINDELTRMTGYSLESIQVLYDGIYIQMVDSRDREGLEECINEQLTNSDRYEVTYRLVTATGGSVWVRESGYLCRDCSPVRQSVLVDISELMSHQEQLAQSEQMFRITNNASGGAVFDFDLSTGTYRQFENAERVYGIPAEKIISDTHWFSVLSPQKSLTAMIDYFYHPDDFELVTEAFERLTQEKEIHYVARSKRADGTFLWTQVHIALIFDENGVPVRRIGHLFDIDELQRHADEMAQSEQLFRITNYASGGAVFDWDLINGCYLHFENAERICGVSAEKIIEETKWFGTLKPEKALDAMISYFYHPDDGYIVIEGFKQLYEKHAVTYVARARRADGSYIWTKVYIALIFDREGKPVRRVGHIFDIDEMTNEMNRLQSRAQEDPLTGIYNKTAAQVIVDTVLKKKDDDVSALMVLDIDNFKSVNDTFGHAVGDAVLIDTCDKLKKAFSSQTLGRVGGDEFIVFAMGLKDQAAILEQADQICTLFHETYIGSNHDYKISCSIGIAISGNENNFSELFKKADAALYQAKASGKDCYCLYQNNNEVGV